MYYKCVKQGWRQVLGDGGGTTNFISLRTAKVFKIPLSGFQNAVISFYWTTFMLIESLELDVTVVLIQLMQIIIFWYFFTYV